MGGCCCKDNGAKQISTIDQMNLDSERYRQAQHPSRDEAEESSNIEEIHVESTESRPQRYNQTGPDGKIQYNAPHNDTLDQS